jgi:hypothetical protein
MLEANVRLDLHNTSVSYWLVSLVKWLPDHGGLPGYRVSRTGAASIMYSTLATNVRNTQAWGHQKEWLSSPTTGPEAGLPAARTEQAECRDLGTTCAAGHGTRSVRSEVRWEKQPGTAQIKRYFAKMWDGTIMAQIQRTIVPVICYVRGNESFRGGLLRIHHSFRGNFPAVEVSCSHSFAILRILRWWY